MVSGVSKYVSRAPAQAPGMGIVPFEQNMLLAIHNSVRLLLTHMRRLVKQKEEVVTLYFTAKAEADAQRAGASALEREYTAARSALDTEIQRHDELRREVRALLHGTNSLEAWNNLSRMVGPL
jgi:hypothetical protein